MDEDCFLSAVYALGGETLVDCYRYCDDDFDGRGNEQTGFHLDLHRSTRNCFQTREHHYQRMMTVWRPALAAGKVQGTPFQAGRFESILPQIGEQMEAG